MVYKSGFKWFMFILTTIVCGGCGVWIYLWTRTGWLYEIGPKAFFTRMAILIVPFLISALITHMYDAETADVEMGVVTFCICLVLPFIGAIIARNELFGLNPHLGHILQIAIPLGITYFLCVIGIIAAYEPVRRPSPAPTRRDDPPPPKPHNPNDDLNSKGLPTGLAN